MGFYIRKAFSFGPVRLNLSRSGLGASLGIKGARIGVGPRGTYIQAGRGGLYYRQTLIPRSRQFRTPQADPTPTPTTDVEQISSSAAQTIVDSSADQLLQAFNRVARRKDIFPACLIVGVFFLARGVLVPVEWWLWTLVLVATATIAIIARHCDVTDGTLVLQYSLVGEARQKFSHLQEAFRQLAACQRIWHVDASGHTDDWKRNAGVNTIAERSPISATFALPPKMTCNVEVPMLKANRNALYLFPDRLLLRDSTGVGTVSYGDLQVAAGLTRFVENEYVPQDAAQVGTTWLYVAKNGGPDRRFNNNRQLPIMSYGTFSFASGSGLNERFECSVPQRATELCTALGAMGSHSESDGTVISFAAPEKQGARHFLLWVSILVMGCGLLLLPFPNSWQITDQQKQMALEQKRQVQQREQLVNKLGVELNKRNFVNTGVTAYGTQLVLRFVKTAPKAARQYGLAPVERKLFFVKTMPPNAELDLCMAGFREIQIKVGEKPPSTLSLACFSQSVKN